MSAKLSGSKRPHDEADDSAPVMTDRMKLAEALKAETAVRFAKLQDRDSGNSGSYSKTMQTDDLVQVYPATAALPKGDFKSVLERDRWYFKNRKSRDSLKQIQSPKTDGSLTPIDIVGYKRPDDLLLELPVGKVKKYKDFSCVPPNMLYFEIVLEAFMGYNLRGLYNSEDSSMPRAAVMGGAVVAALTSWRDKKVLEIFQESQLEPFLTKKSSTVEDYVNEKKEIIMTIHLHFFESKETPSPIIGARKSSTSKSSTSPKSSQFNGDVDIFLQASPNTRLIGGKFPNEVGEKVLEFSGDRKTDLHKFTDAAAKHIESEEVREIGKFIYALTNRCLSFMMTTHGDPEDYENEEVLWPRTSQFIMLDPKADLVGALMDFDIAACSCAYNGVGVSITPRAEFALQTMTSVVTPFCLEEKRNRGRIVKYWKRGFNPVVLDPYCESDDKCLEKCNCEIQKSEDGPKKPSGGTWDARNLRGEEYEESLEQVHAAQEGSNYYCACCSPGTQWHGHYSLSLFEKEEGHATEYFAKCYSWSEDQLAEVMNIPPLQRRACVECHAKYKMSLFLEEEPTIETAEEVLHSANAVRYGNNYNVCPSFYGGSVFDSYYARGKARPYYMAEALMRCQTMAEKCRYVLRHGTLSGFRDRILHSCGSCAVSDYNEDGAAYNAIFEAASKHVFPKSNRAPIGLNPERFVAKCQSCETWLPECEYGTEYCTACSNKKPAAK